MNRRSLLTTLPALLAVPMLPVSASPMEILPPVRSLEDLKAELWELLSAQVPDGTELSSVTMHISRRHSFHYLQAKDPEWNEPGSPFWNRDSNEAEWVLHVPG